MAIKQFEDLFVLLLQCSSVFQNLPLIRPSLLSSVPEGGGVCCPGRVRDGVCVYVCIQQDRFPMCRHHVPFDSSYDWSFETYLAAVIFQTHTRGRHRKGVAVF